MADHKELAAFALQRTRMPMVVADACEPDYPIVLANHAFLDLTGYSAEELLGRNCRMLQGEATSKTAVAQIRAIIAQEQEGTVEILNYRKDGSTFWNQLYLSPIRDDDGRLVYYFASQIDVTEYRKVQTLEEAEHRLLLEVDHRTKNVLAIVDSIVRLSKSDNATLYAASVQQRVQALSRMHMLLADNGWQQVLLRDIVSLQIGVFDDRNVKIDGPDIMIPAPPCSRSASRYTSLQPMPRFTVRCRTATAGLRSAGQIQATASVLSGGNSAEWCEGPSPGKGFGNVLLGAV